MNSKEGKKCPKCGSLNYKELIWGYPARGFALLVEKNPEDFELRGCLVDSDSKRWQCKDCLNEWGDINFD